MKNTKKIGRNSVTGKVTTDVTFTRNRPSPVMARVSRDFFASGYGYIKFLKSFQVPNSNTIALYYIIIINIFVLII